MALRFYFVPQIGDGITPSTGFAPKYFHAIQTPTGPQAMGALDFGFEDIYLVGADVNGATHTALVANNDVLAVPTPITTLISSGALNVVKTKLEAANIPADWVTTSMNYQTVMSRIIKVARFYMRFRALFGRLYQAGVTLDTLVNQFPANVRNRLDAGATSLGSDTSSIVGSMPFRQALMVVTDQLPGITFCGVQF